MVQYLWWKGPPFLQSLDDQWPKNPVQEMNDEVESEVVKSQPLITSSLVNTTSDSFPLNIEEVIDVNQYSNLNRLLRVTFYVVRSITRSRSRGDPPPTLALTVSEMNHVEALWIKTIQQKSFDVDLRLKKGTSSPPVSGAIWFIFE